MEGDGEEPSGDEAKARDGPRRLASLLTIMSAGYQLQCLYRCRESIQLLHKLPRRHFSSAWVQQLLGRAYCECNDYKPSLRAMKEMLRLEPFRLEGTELLSTVLWHLKRDKDLCRANAIVIVTETLTITATISRCAATAHTLHFDRKRSLVQTAAIAGVTAICGHIRAVR